MSDGAFTLSAWTNRTRRIEHAPSAATPIPSATSSRAIPAVARVAPPTGRSTTGRTATTTRPRRDAGRRMSSTKTSNGSSTTYSTIRALTVGRLIQWSWSLTTVTPLTRSQQCQPWPAVATASAPYSVRSPNAMSGAPTVTGEGPTSSVGGGGAPGTIRTCNLLIRSQMLYPLSYGRLAGD